MKPLLLLLGMFLLSSLSVNAQRIPLSTATDTEQDPLESWEQQGTDWQELANLAGRFKVLSPGSLQEKIDSIDTPLGQMVYHTFYCQPPEESRENEVYMISYVDYPSGTLHSDSIDLVNELLDESQTAAAESVRGELLFSQNGAQNGYPFRYWRIDYLNGRASIRTKALVVKNRFYTIQTVARRELGMNHATDRFIDSFRVF